MQLVPDLELLVAQLVSNLGLPVAQLVPDSELPVAQFIQNSEPLVNGHRYQILADIIYSEENPHTQSELIPPM